MSKKLTPWFPGSVKPVHVGVYMLRSGCGDLVGYQYWDGALWGVFELSPRQAFTHQWMKAANRFQNDAWRGLAVKP